MKRFKLIVFIVVVSFGESRSQHFQYTYDGAGNRHTRTYSSTRMANPDLPKDSISSFDNLGGVDVIPNPTSGLINVTIASLKDDEKAIVVLSDDQGKSIFLKQQNSKQAGLDLAALKPGIYYLRVILNNRAASFKVVKL